MELLILLEIFQGNIILLNLPHILKMVYIIIHIQIMQMEQIMNMVIQVNFTLEKFEEM